MACGNPNCPKCNGGRMNQKDRIVTIGDTGIIYEKSFNGEDVKLGKTNKLIEQEQIILQTDNDELDKKLGKAMDLIYTIYEKKDWALAIPRPQTQATVNDQLLRKIEQLEAKIQNLEKGDVIKL